MKLYRKLVLLVAGAAVAPFAGMGVITLRGAESALSTRVALEQTTAAQRAALSVAGDLERIYDEAHRHLSSWTLEELSDAELSGFLRLLLGTSAEIGAAALVDDTGHTAVPPLQKEDEPDGMEPFLKALPAREALEHGLPALSSAFFGPDGRARIALALPVKGRRAQLWVVGIRIDLASLQERIAVATGTAGSATLLDAQGRVLLAIGPAGRPYVAEDGAAARRLRDQRGGAGQYLGAGGAPMLAAFAPVPGEAGWGIFVRLPAAEAFADVARLRRLALWVSMASLAVFLLVAWLFVRRVTRGLARIDWAAREMGRGNLAVRVPVRGRDEVAQVSTTLNQVGAELEVARGRLERWNEELKAEVDARTRDLKEAQAQLLEAQKLAAIGQLGAGVAHEINNPLSVILGHAQLLIASKAPSDPDRTTLLKMEQLARRCREITQNLLRFSHQKPVPDFQELDLNQVVRESLSLVEGQVRESGIALEVELAEPLPVVKGDSGHLGQVLLNLVGNARTACRDRPSPRICVSTRSQGAQVLLSVVDTGKGIAPDILPRIFEPFFTTKDVWSNVGLGLSVSYRIVAEHGGRIQVESRPGEGSTFQVLLPAVEAAGQRAVC